MKLLPPKLKEGDEVRIIAPSMSLNQVSKDNINFAINALKTIGLNITFSKNAYKQYLLGSSSIQSRLDDLHEAFRDKNVKAILAALGGSNCNQLLQHIDYDLIKNNPKIFCGFSDITALQNAILHKTDLITYSGPSFSLFAMNKGFEYTSEFFKKVLFQNLSNITLLPSSLWSDDDWYLDQTNRVFHKNESFWIINPGEAKGRIIGGNLGTFKLLHGTIYMPSLEDSILFLEADSVAIGNCVGEYDRDLQSLIHQPGFNKVKGVVLGRFEKKFGMDIEKLKFIISSKDELKNIPIIANVDFGHTAPIITFPIGGLCEVKACSIRDIQINLIKP